MNALKHRRWARLYALGLTTLALLAPLALLPALARAGTYVAMGDSYSSGLGTREYYAESGICRRSPHAYPVKVAPRIGHVLRFVACSGARTEDVLNNQLGPLSVSTSRVTISIGGNDAGFASVIKSCARPWPWTCWGDIGAARSYIRNTLPGRLDSVYAAIDRRAAAATVAVVGYPWIFNGHETCDLGASISAGERAELNQTAELLASVTRGRARAHGFAYVDPIPPFAGHAVCDPMEWVNGLSLPIGESYHPNRAGHQAYAKLVTSALTAVGRE